LSVRLGVVTIVGFKVPRESEGAKTFCVELVSHYKPGIRGLGEGTFSERPRELGLSAQNGEEEHGLRQNEHSEG